MICLKPLLTSWRWLPRSRWLISASPTCPASGSISPFRPTCWRQTRSRTASRSMALDPRLQGDPRVGHAADARSGHRVYRSDLRDPDAGRDRRRFRPDHPRALLARSALHRAPGRGLPQADRHRGCCLHGARAGVLHLQRCALRRRHERGVLSHRQPRGLVEQRPGSAPEFRRSDRAQARATSPPRRPTPCRMCAARS